MVENTLVSVIMSIYNENEEELSLSISSILNQTYSNIELIIVNDNPENKVANRVISHYKNNDDRITGICNQKNIGLVDSLNKALSYCNGCYIARMDGDDISKKDRILHQMAYINAHNLDLIGGYTELINDHGDLLNKVVKFPSDESKIKKSLKYGNCIAHPTWLAKKEVYESLNGYRKIPYCEDYDFILRASNLGFHLGNIPETVLRYRTRENSISGSNKNRQKVIRYYLSENKNRIEDVDVRIFNDLSTFDLMNEYNMYLSIKEKFKLSLKKYNLKDSLIYMIKLGKYPFLSKEITDKIRYLKAQS